MCALRGRVSGAREPAGGVVDQANITRAFEITARTLDRVAERTREREFLVSERFSLTDLAAAALLAPVVRVRRMYRLHLGDDRLFLRER
ncbi:MAG: glutathione binding-like protein [Gammaproteobacteria bacterium]